MPQLMPDDDSIIFDESRSGKLSAGISNKFNAYLTVDEVQVDLLIFFCVTFVVLLILLSITWRCYGHLFAGSNLFPSRKPISAAALSSAAVLQKSFSSPVLPTSSILTDPAPSETAETTPPVTPRATEGTGDAATTSSTVSPPRETNIRASSTFNSISLEFTPSTKELVSRIDKSGK
eukprot:TRINITY_DN14290_c0_g1_i1.p1 TRINITY_DN14290_c0_g1~~TRINITY_DN14290_c0_g1_i1.p1  ORF type:complete len:177 (+),score=25.87 TRINITY_DN14290_c0_g1_i1:3-533(+)